MMLGVWLRDCQQMNSGTGFRILDRDTRNCLSWTELIRVLEMPILASKPDLHWKMFEYLNSIKMQF